MDRTVSILCFVLAAFGLSCVVGCESTIATTVTTTSSSASSSGMGGEGGEAGGGGMAGAGGMGGGGMAGAGGMGGEGGGEPVCMKPPAACGGCMYDQCNIAFCDCAAEPGCYGLIGCIQGCAMDTTCIQGCYSMNASGFSEFIIVSSCAGTLCAPSCNGAEQVKPCDLCLAQKCEPELEACTANTNCFPLIKCYQTCMGDMTCQQTCAGMYPDAVQLAQSLFICSAQGCPNACN